jgi:hypothetical protein
MRSRLFRSRRSSVSRTRERSRRSTRRRRRRWRATMPRPRSRPRCLRAVGECDPCADGEPQRGRHGASWPQLRDDPDEAAECWEARRAIAKAPEVVAGDEECERDPTCSTPPAPLVRVGDAIPGATRMFSRSQALAAATCHNHGAHHHDDDERDADAAGERPPRFPAFRDREEKPDASRDPPTDSSHVSMLGAP